MRVTINRVDGHVLVGGQPRDVDCSSLPAYVGVIQWDGGAAAGCIEFVNDGYGVFLPNTKIVDFAPYAYLIEAWRPRA
jgi:hypothetical protein